MMLKSILTFVFDDSSQTFYFMIFDDRLPSMSAKDVVCEGEGGQRAEMHAVAE